MAMECAAPFGSSSPLSVCLASSVSVPVSGPVSLYSLYSPRLAILQRSRIVRVIQIVCVCVFLSKPNNLSQAALAAGPTSQSVCVFVCV
jgi:hypothetical protein